MRAVLSLYVQAPRALCETPHAMSWHHIDEIAALPKPYQLMSHAAPQDYWNCPVCAYHNRCGPVDKRDKISDRQRCRMCRSEIFANQRFPPTFVPSTYLDGGQGDGKIGPMADSHHNNARDFPIMGGVCSL